jgi:glucosamine--fructose-6-phosphate aminotransferase (isomerizing)
MDHGLTAGQHTLSEIRSQPQAWAAVVPAARSAEAEWRSFFAGEESYQNLLFGCGSTFYLSMTAAAVLQAVTGQVARAVPSSELLFYEKAWIASGLGVRGLAISRSGTTTETLRALEALSGRDAARVRLGAVTCYAGTPMETWCSPVLVSPKGYETSIAQTRSFASMLVGCLAIAGIVSRHERLLEALASLPPIGQRLLDRYDGLAASLGGDSRIARIFFLGSGPRYGLACEGMLKMKEMSLTNSEAYHFLEFRHGPKSMVDSSTLVVGLLSDAARAAETQLLREMKELGATLLVLAESNDGLDWADAVVPFASGFPEAARLPLYLPVLQLLAYHRSVSKGLDPDAPRNLDAVVKLGEE